MNENVMTLSFSTIWPNKMGDLAGKPNFFIEKIWAGIPEYDFKDRDHEYYAEQFKDMKWEHWHGYIEGVNALKGGMTTPFLPKKHTIRPDNKNRWVAGRDIHYVINNRTKDRFQFVPVIKCKSIQKIKIIHSPNFGGSPRVIIDGDIKPISIIERLAINDGFPSVKSFFDWFNEDFERKIIHWTELKY